MDEQQRELVQELPSHSPVIIHSSEPDLNFSQAIGKLLSGSRISRRLWNDRRSYYLLDNGFISVHKAGEKESVIRPVILNDGDMLGIDWFEL